MHKQKLDFAILYKSLVHRDMSLAVKGSRTLVVSQLKQAHDNFNKNTLKTREPSSAL